MAHYVSHRRTLKHYVFRSRQNARYDGDVLIDTGNVRSRLLPQPLSPSVQMWWTKKKKNYSRRQKVTARSSMSACRTTKNLRSIVTAERSVEPTAHLSSTQRRWSTSDCVTIYVRSPLRTIWVLSSSKMNACLSLYFITARDLSFGSTLLMTFYFLFKINMAKGAQRHLHATESTEICI